MYRLYQHHADLPYAYYITTTLNVNQFNSYATTVPAPVLDQLLTYTGKIELPTPRVKATLTEFPTASRQTNVTVADPVVIVNSNPLFAGLFTPVANDLILRYVLMMFPYSSA